MMLSLLDGIKFTILLQVGIAEVRVLDEYVPAQAGERDGIRLISKRRAL
jgi:hypothetical protein